MVKLRDASFIYLVGSLNRVNRVTDEALIAETAV